ncbi:MAG TPA: serine/threonine-protein kinase, partial [Kofleriaceae bacterium]
MATGGRDDAGTLTTSYEGVESRAEPRVPAPVPVPVHGGALQPGDQIGRYVVEEPLGQGGMGVVVAAHDPELARQVALKVVRPGVGDRPYRRRLVREARAMAQLEHANVVRVYDAGEVDGEVFVAMELVRGETLGQWLRASPRPWREVLARFIAAGRGLAAAHRAGLVHRDFKPDNVLVRATDGRV